MIRRSFAAAVACALLAACGQGQKGAPAAPAAPASPAPASPSAPAGPQEATNGGVALTDTDEKLATGQYYDGYPLRVAPGKGTVITVKANGFRPVIVVIDSNRQKVTEVQGQGGDAQLSETYPPGDYYILVCASDVGATGRYTIEVQSSTPIG